MNFYLKKIICVMIILFISIPASAVEFSGYLDIIASDRQGGGNSTFSTSEFELDVKHKFNDKYSVVGELTVSGGGTTAIEEAYILYNHNNLLNFKAGAIGIPLGAEAFDAPDMLTTSHSLLWNYLTAWSNGALAFGKINDIFDYNLWMTNGFGANPPAASSDDNNNAKNYGGRLGISPVKDLTAGVSYTAAKENVSDTRDKLLDIDFKYVFKSLTILAEYMYRKNISADNTKYKGYMGTLSYPLSSKFTGTVRYSSVKIAQNPRVKEFTANLSTSLISNVCLLLEYRLNREAPSVKNNQMSIECVAKF